MNKRTGFIYIYLINHKRGKAFFSVEEIEYLEHGVSFKQESTDGYDGKVTDEIFIPYTNIELIENEL